MRRVPHGRGEVALHQLKDGSGPTLLCIHELEGRGEQWHAAVQAWPWAAVAVDLGGHGESSWLAGGGYAPELFAADADVALATLPATEPVAVVGAGIGAYAALLLSGSRSDVIAVAGLLPGRGLDGGGAHPAESPLDRDIGDRLLELADRSGETALATDPLVELCYTDLRPTDYAAFFAAAAPALLLGEDGGVRPPWWRKVSESERSSVGPVEPAAMVAALALAVSPDQRLTMN
jgi:pimeloyl-ACP methyl ester carboxylesterase